MKLKYVVYALTALVLIQIYSIYNLRQINKALIEANESTQDLAKIGHLFHKDYLISLKSEGYALPKGIFLETKDPLKMKYTPSISAGGVLFLLQKTKLHQYWIFTSEIIR